MKVVTTQPRSAEHSHEKESRESSEEDGQLVVPHGEDCREEEGFVPDLGDEDDGDGLAEPVEDSPVAGHVDQVLQQGRILNQFRWEVVNIKQIFVDLVWHC